MDNILYVFVYIYIYIFRMAIHPAVKNIQARTGRIVIFIASRRLSAEILNEFFRGIFRDRLRKLASFTHALRTVLNVRQSIGQTALFRHNSVRFRL